MHEKQRQGGGASTSKKLLAAIAVLAVAFAVFAAIPVAVDDSDAAESAKAAKIGTTEYDTLDAAIDANEKGAGSATIILLKNCTIDTEFKLTKAVTFDGTSAKYTITLNKDLHVTANVKVTFKNLNICNTDVKGDKDDSGDSNEILVEKGTIEMDTVVFTGVHSVEYGTTIQNEATAGTFTNVDFNDKVLGVNSTNAKVTFTKCSDVRINYPNSEANLKISQKAETTIAKIIIDASTAETTTLNFAAGTSGITLDLNRETFQFENITERQSAAEYTGKLTIKNGTLKDTTFSVYHGDETDYKAEKGYYRSSVVVFGDSLTLAGTTNVKVQQDRYSNLAIPDGKTVTVSGTVALADGSSIVLDANTKIGTDGLTVNTWKLEAIDVVKNGGLEFGKNSVTLNGDYEFETGFTVPANKNLYVNGKVTFTALTLNGTLVVEKDATVALGQYDKAESIPKDKIVNLGGTVTAKVEDGDKYNSVTVEADKDSKVPVSTVTDLNEALAKGAPVQITGGVKITADDVITVVPGSSISGKITFKSEVSGDTNESVTFKNVTGNFKVAKGNSIDISDATKIQGTITVDSGKLEISGKITGDLTITTTNVADEVKFSNVTVNSGVTLTLVGPGKFTVVAEKAFNLYGSIANGNTPATGATTPALINVIVPEKATFKAYSGSQIAGTIFVTGSSTDGVGTIDLTQAQNPQTVGEDISYPKTYGQLENVTIVGSLTIKNNTTVTVLGGFQVNEGITLTIEKGSKLVIDSLAASMIVDGRIVVEEGATLEVKNAKDVKVSGSIESEGTVIINSNVTVKSGGSIVINDNSTTVSGVTTYKSTFSATKDLVVEAGAELIIKSKVAGATVTNKGTVTLDGAVLGGTFNVNMAADKAVVQVLKVQAESGSQNVTITDEGLVFADKKKVGGTGTEAGGVPNSVAITVNGYDMKGLNVVETVSSVTKNGTTTYYNTLDLAGAVSIASVNDTALNGTKDVVSVSGERIAITGELTLGKYVKLIVAEKEVSVSGKLVATEDGSEIANSGEITVTGLVQALSSKKIADVINAAMYESKIGTTTIYNYTTLNAAIDSGAKDITVSGIVYVTESVTVPAGVTIKNNGEIVVGSPVDTEVVLTVTDTATIKYGDIDVYGTLYFENKKDNKAAKIESDVSVIGEKDARYTNLFTALNNANAGETVTVDRETVVLAKSITIKDGVTLDVPNGKKLKVSAGVTITVNGTLKTAEKIETADGVVFALAADKLNNKAAIIVNGVFMSMAAVDYNTDAKYMIPGAYYSLIDDAGAYNYVTTLENASKAAATPVTVYGKVSAGDVVFTGTDSALRSVVVADDADLTVASITLDKTTFTVNATGKFTGDVKAGDAAVSVKLVKDMAVSVDKDGLFTVDDVKAADAKSSFKVSAGSVYIDTASMDVTVSAGATLVSAAAGTVLKEGLTIEGTVTVANEQTITVKGDVTVKGALSVADATDSKVAGTFNAEKYLYIGLTSKDVTGDAASVSGAVSEVQVAFVKADANVSDATIESFKVDGVLKSTTYVIEGKDWMTVYDRTGNYNIGKVTEAPFENAEFKADKWLNTDGESADIKVIGAPKCDKVTANIEYKIYTIQITPCAGIESIAIDGNLIGDYNYGDYSDVKVKAGSHTVTYSLANGYSGEAKLSLVESGDKTTASVSGQTFTVSGEKGVVKLQLTGVEKSGYVDSVVPEQKDDDDGMSLTDILLIVLVVLIVIMAIIVAMRLMRS